MDRVKLQGPLASLARLRQMVSASRPGPGLGGEPGSRARPQLTLSAAARDVPGGGNALRELASVLPALAQPGMSAGLPPASAALLDKLLKAFPALRDLAYPHKLRQAMDNSGLFLEARLAAAPAPGKFFDTDLKALLARLARSLEAGGETRDARALREYGANAPAALLPGGAGRHRLQLRLDEALARITRLQGDTLDALDHGEKCWTFDLPVTHREQTLVVSMRIARQRGGCDSAEEEDGWRVAFALELDGLGLVQMDALLHEEGVRLSTRAARADTLALLKKHQETLRENFEARGLVLETSYSRLDADDEALQ